MSGISARSSCAGFTLIEALTATLLMGIIFTALATITAQWLPNWAHGFTRLQRGGALAVSLERLTDDLAAAQYVSAGTAKTPLFEGSQLSVIFVRRVLAPNVVTGLEVIRLAEVSDDGGIALVRSSAPLPIEGVANAGGLLFGSSVVLVRSPYRVSFAYAGADRRWKDEWSGKAELPRAIRVSFRDNATSLLLDVSTSTVVHAELPARCAWQGAAVECPMLTSKTSPDSRARLGSNE
jgi:general secretion pathway protein J